MKKQTFEGIVTKVTENEYVLLCDDGTFKNIPRAKNEMPMMGEKMTYSTRAQFRPTKYVSTIVMAAILFIAFLSYGMLQNRSETCYIVAIDINPSIEAYLDQNLDVVKLSPLNTDGKQIVDAIESENLDLHQALSLIISESISKGYLTTEEKGRIETTIVKVTDDSNNLSKRKLTKVIQTQLQGENIVADVQIVNEAKEFYDQAKRTEISVNKYRHFQTLQEKGIVQNIHEIKEKSVRELQDMIEDDLKKLPDKAKQEGDSREENAKINSELRQERPQHLKNQKRNQTEKPATEGNKDEQQQDRNTKTSKETPSLENKDPAKSNYAENKQIRTKNENGRDKEKNQKKKLETGEHQTNSNENNSAQNKTSRDNQPKKESNVGKKLNLPPKSYTDPEEDNLDSNHNKASKNKPSSPSKP